MNTLTRPIFEIDLKSIISNYKSIEAIVKKTKIAAVVKDDAYGFGAKIVSKILYENTNCADFFVAHAVEGKVVRKSCKNAKIYVLQGIGDDCIDIYKKYKLTPVINSIEQLEYWKKHRIKNIKPVINIDTGLNRLGFRQEYLSTLSKEDIAEFSLVMSHLACADDDESEYNTFQLENFKKAKETFFPHLPGSLSASDGTMLGKDFHFDMVRIGAGLYGIEKVKYMPPVVKNVSLIKAPIIQISKIVKGDCVGYSNTYVANETKKIAIISIGYGDGLSRRLSNLGKVFINNEPAKILGRVSMDNIICDISDIPNAKLGDFAELINDNHDIDEMAEELHTVGHEVTSNFGKNQRFTKKYIY